MTKKERQLYKRGRKNPDGYKKIPTIFKIKYKKKILVTSLLILIFSIVFNISIGLNILPVHVLYSKLGIIKGIEKQDSDFTIYYLDVGQSDCSIIICDGKVMMIDAGTKSQNVKIKSALFVLGIDKIDYLIVTHPHDDHMGNAAELIRKYNVESIVMPRISKENQVDTLTFNNLINSIAKYNVNPMTASSGERINLGRATIDFVAPFEQNDNLNNMSIVLKVTFEETSFLFQGDAEETIENQIVSSNIDVSSDVIKVGHHGSNTSSTVEYLEKVNPSVAIVSCGADNTFKHPNKQTIDTLEEQHIKTYITAYNGNITVTSDGESIDVTYENKNV